MRVRGIRYFERVLSENSRTNNKQFVSYSSLPKNIEEEMNWDIAFYFVSKQTKNKLVA